MNCGSFKKLGATTPFNVWFLLLGLLFLSAAAVSSLLEAVSVTRYFIVAAVICGIPAFNVFTWLAKPFWKNNANRRKLASCQKYNLKR